MPSLDFLIFYVQALVNQLFLIAYLHGYHAHPERGLGQGNSTVDRVNASVHAGMATVVVSVDAGAGGGGLATGEHFLESEKSVN